MKKTTPIFPTTVADMQSNPAIVEHWPHVARLITGYLLTVLHRNGAQGKNANTAEHAVGAALAISEIIEDLAKLGDPAPEPQRRPTIAPLNRFSENPPGENTKPNTPAK